MSFDAPLRSPAPATLEAPPNAPATIEAPPTAPAVPATLETLPTLLNVPPAFVNNFPVPDLPFENKFFIFEPNLPFLPPAESNNLSVT